MEATNISINKQSSVSINIETLQAIKQRVLQAVKQATNVCCNVGAAAWDAVREKVRTIDVGNVLSNLWIGGWSIACFYLIYMYA